MYPTNKILESRFNFDSEEFSEELNLIGFINEDLKYILDYVSKI